MVSIRNLANYPKTSLILGLGMNRNSGPDFEKKSGLVFLLIFVYFCLPKALALPRNDISFPLRSASDMEHTPCLFFGKISLIHQPTTPNTEPAPRHQQAKEPECIPTHTINQHMQYSLPQRSVLNLNLPTPIALSNRNAEQNPHPKPRTAGARLF